MATILLAVVFLALLVLGLVIVPQDSCKQWLSDAITNQLSANLKYHLYTNNVAISATTVLGDFTEAVFAGYVAQTATGWSTPALLGAIATSTAGALTFNNTSGSAKTIYGVYVTDNASAKLYYAEADPNAPISIPNGGAYVYTPNFQVKSIN